MHHRLSFVDPEAVANHWIGSVDLMLLLKPSFAVHLVVDVDCQCRIGLAAVVDFADVADSAVVADFVVEEATD